jgi:hypothetical protein
MLLVAMAAFMASNGQLLWAPTASSIPATPSHIQLSPFPTYQPDAFGTFVPNVSSSLVPGDIGDEESLESALSDALVACGALKFEWDHLYDEPPGSLVNAQIEGPPTEFIHCVSTRVPFDAYVR